MVIKKGDIVVCVSTDSQYLTNGKKYYVYETYDFRELYEKIKEVIINPKV